MNEPLYIRAMGAEFDRLPAAVQRFHRLQGAHTLHGEVTIAAPESWAARWIGRALGSGQADVVGPISFDLNATPTSEHWVRHFPGKTMQSTLVVRDGRLCEQLGAAGITFALSASGERLSMGMHAMRFFGIPCPAWLRPRIVAEEHGDGDAIHFNVSAHVIGIGRVTAYHGYLTLPPQEGATP